MKKLIFLLILAVAFAGVVLADSPVNPPGVLTLEAALYGNSVDGYVVNPYTVLAQETRNRVDDTMKAREEAIIMTTSSTEVDKYLRAVGYIITWGDQYLAGELTKDEYASLVSGAIGLLRYIKPMGVVLPVTAELSGYTRQGKGLRL